MNRTKIDQLISNVKAKPEDDAFLANTAVDLAAELLSASREVETWSEKRQGAQLARMMEDGPGKAFTIAMADQVFRPPSSERSAAQFRHLVDSYGVPEYLGLPERAAMMAGAAASTFPPRHRHASRYDGDEEGKLNCHSTCRGKETQTTPSQTPCRRCGNEPEPTG